MLAEGHALGSHTMEHEKATETSIDDYIKSVQKGIEITDSKLFRPPYGRLPFKYRFKLPKDAKVIMWSWLSYDFDENVPIQKIMEKLSFVKPGDILVFHDNEKVQDRIKKLLPDAIVLLKDKGLKFNTVSV